MSFNIVYYKKNHSVLKGIWSASDSSKPRCYSHFQMSRWSQERVKDCGQLEWVPGRVVFRSSVTVHFHTTSPNRTTSPSFNLLCNFLFTGRYSSSARLHRPLPLSHCWSLSFKVSWNFSWVCLGTGQIVCYSVLIHY